MLEGSASLRVFTFCFNESGVLLARNAGISSGVAIRGVVGSKK
jgi:hypothetical protein